MTTKKEMNDSTIALGLIMGLPLLMLFSNEWIRWFGVLWAFGLVILLALIFRQEQQSKLKSDFICDDCMEALDDKPF